jgi:hypothetical protein
MFRLATTTDASRDIGHLSWHSRLDRPKRRA